MVVNIRALDPEPAGLPTAQTLSYEGETTGDRDTRRRTRWMPVVRS